MLFSVLTLFVILVSGAESIPFPGFNSTEFKKGHKQTCNSQITPLYAEFIWQTFQFPQNSHHGGGNSVPCSWRIESSSGVALYIDEIHNVKVNVYDGHDTDAPVMDAVTGNNEGTIYYSSGSHVLVAIDTSDYDKHDDNNHFVFQFIDQQGIDESCSSQSELFYATTQWTDLSSPGYISALHGHGEHHDTYSCSWTFHSASRLAVKIVDFDLDASSGDSLTIYDGSVSSAHSTLAALNDLQKGFTYESSGGYMLIQLSSSRSDSSNGFYLQYAAVENTQTTTESQTTTTEKNQVSTTTERITTTVTATAGYTTTNVTEATDSASNGIPPGIMTLLWILLFFAIILVCPVVYKLVTKCCSFEEPHTGRNSGNNDVWYSTDQTGAVNRAFSKTEVDLPPAYDTLSLKEGQSAEKSAENLREPPPPTYEQTSSTDASDAKKAVE